MRNLYSIGLKKFEKLQFKESIDFFTKSINQNPNHLFSYLYRGLAYIEISEYNNAKDDLNFVLKLDPDNSEAKSNLRIIMDKLKK